MNRDIMVREIQEKYRQSARYFNELERRHWAATEALKLGRGGISIVSEALRISPNTIKKGLLELTAGPPKSSAQTGARIRRPGGGRKSKSMSSDDRSFPVGLQRISTESSTKSRESDDNQNQHRSPTNSVVPIPTPIDDSPSDRESDPL